MGKYLGQKNRINVNWWVGLLISFLVCAFYAALVSFKTMPISEGWYSEYAWLINNGSVPYRDFEYLFFPLYMFIIAGFTNIFGYSVFALRILGVIVFAGIGVALYCVFAKLFDNFSATIGAIVGALYLQSEVAQIFYDYIRFHDLFAILTLYMLICITSKCLNPQPMKDCPVVLAFDRICVTGIILAIGVVGLLQYPFSEAYIIPGVCLVLIILALVKVVVDFFLSKNTKLHKIVNKTGTMSSVMCGIFVSAECMIKQSNGFIMIALLLIYLICCGIFLKQTNFFRALRGVVSGMVFSFGLLLLYLLQTNSLRQFVQCCFGSALAAKGGILTALFNWIPSNLELYFPRMYVTVFVILALYFSISRYVANGNPEMKAVSIPKTIIAGMAGILICWGCVNSVDLATTGMLNYDYFLPMSTFFSCAILFLSFVFYILWMYLKQRGMSSFVYELMLCFPVLGVVFAQGYGSGMSGGLSESQTAIGLGFLISICAHVAIRANIKAIVAIVSAVAVCLSFTFVGRKVYSPYSWWELQQGMLAEHTETVDVPMLEGIQVRPLDKLCYETIYDDIINNTSEGDTIFAFPHCPIVYTMTDRHSVTYSKVQWFDVSSSSAILGDIERLRTDPPKVIVYVRLADSAYASHEEMFSSYHTGQMRDFILQDLIPNNNYSLLHEIDLQNGFVVYTYSR